MLLGGLWHGAAWTFVAWGGLHGLYLVVERFLKSKISLQINAINGFIFALLTYFLVNITWVFFRAQDFGQAIQVLAAMFFIDTGGEKVLQHINLWIIFILIPVLFVTHWVMRNTSVKEVASKSPQWVVGVVWAVMFILIALAQGTGEQFIYFQF
jgi:alginate O-acetyltransferase complex protein AlgI